MRKIPNYIGITKLGLIPLRNFAMVDKKKGLYRSAQPMYGYEYEWLKNKLGINTIVNLRSELNHDSTMLKSLTSKIGDIEVITFDVPDHCTPTLKQAKEFIDLIKNRKNVLFHCEHGHGRTSTFCVLSRIAMGWTLEDALREEAIVFGYQFRHPKQLDFLRKNFG